jgi:hypothetical protein
MADSIDHEVQAIGTVLKALDRLDAKARCAVLEYVIGRLDIGIAAPKVTTGGAPDPAPNQSTQSASTTPEPTHLAELVAQKKPKSAVEMATIVAYYLLELAPEGERRDTLKTKDIETYFKIGGFRLPKEPQYTLPNTKNAGYIDSVGSGEYKLNPVGHNLVVHSLPATSKQPQPNRKKRKSTSKKSSSAGK